MDKDLMEQLLNEAESETLDFKRDQYPFNGATDEQKSELLKDILIFANSWKRTDAYILVGVEEVKGGRSKPVGVTSHLDDANLQQFVNSKTQRQVAFSYKAFPFEGVQIGVIRIPVQDRPVYLTKDFGKLKKNIVYVRRGSSTVEADPDEIARMGLSKQFSMIAERQDYERQQKILSVQPFLQGSGGNYNRDSGEFHLKNKGEAIKNLSFEWPGEIKGTVRSTRYLDKEHEIIIKVEHMPNPLPKEFPVLIRYEDKLGNKNSMLLHYDFEERQWIPDEPNIGG